MAPTRLAASSGESCSGLFSNRSGSSPARSVPLAPKDARPFFTFLRLLLKSPCASLTTPPHRGGAIRAGAGAGLWPSHLGHGPEGHLETFSRISAWQKKPASWPAAHSPRYRGGFQSPGKLPLVHQNRHLKRPGEQPVGQAGRYLIGQVGYYLIAGRQLDLRASPAITWTLENRPRAGPPAQGLSPQHRPPPPLPARAAVRFPGPGPISSTPILRTQVGILHYT